MRLLVTRPAANAAPLAETLARAGHDVLVSPVIEIYPEAAALPSLDDIGALAFTSANGVLALHAGLARDRADGSNRGDWQGLPAYAVGPQTAAALRACGWQNVHEARGDVAALSALIGAHYRLRDKTILHLAGTHRAGNLAASLEAQGLKPALLVLYTAEPAEALSAAAQAALEDAEEPVAGVLLYSQRSASHFLKLCAGLHMQAKPVAYCLSPSIAALMSAAGFETRCAARPDEAALLALLG